VGLLSSALLCAVAVSQSDAVGHRFNKKGKEGKEGKTGDKEGLQLIL
jgi:hypothetical protein